MGLRLLTTPIWEVLPPTARMRRLAYGNTMFLQIWPTTILTVRIMKLPRMKGSLLRSSSTSLTWLRRYRRLQVI